MCGRYFLFLSPERLQQLFVTQTVTDYNPSANITPLQFAPLIVRRRMGMGRWGLLPDYAGHDDKTLCAKLKNVRSETVAKKPSFANLWGQGRRCLIPASGFLEWPEEKIKGHPGYQMTLAQEGYGEGFALAGLWTKRDDLVTFAVLTRAASPELSQFHSRMPVAFYPHQMEAWTEASPDKALHMMAHESILTGWQIKQREPAPPPQNGLFAA